MKVPTMYTRLIQGYHAMDPDVRAASASAARNLRLMVREKGTLTCIKHFYLLKEDNRIFVHHLTNKMLFFIF